MPDSVWRGLNTAYSRPISKAKFRVEIDGLDIGGFQDVSGGFKIDVDAHDYREGDMVQNTMKIVGLNKYQDLSLKKGLMYKDWFYDWILGSLNGQPIRKTIRVVAMDNDGTDVAAWVFVNAWPKSYQGTDFSGKSSDVAIESLSLCHEGVTKEMSGNTEPAIESVGGSEGTSTLG